MADTKFSALTALTGANSAPLDLLAILDVSDTSMAASGTNKSITRQEIQTYNAGTLTTDVKVQDLSVTWNAAGVTFIGLKFNVTNTASNAASYLVQWQVGGVIKSGVRVDGRVYGEAFGTSSGGYVIASNGFWIGDFSSTTSNKCLKGNFAGDDGLCAINSANSSYRTLGASNLYLFGADTTLDVTLTRDAANTLAQRNGTNAQTFRTYGTYTDASNYRRVAIAMTTAGVASITPEGAGTGSSGNVLHISGLPTSNPGPGILWNNAGTPAIGT